MNMIKKLKAHEERMQDFSIENIFANVWHDTIRGVSWLDDLASLSPGRSAVGYNYLYVMTRILDEIHPKRVLDIGLGISSTLISCYFNGIYNLSTDDKRFIHMILEHDKSWVDFYTKNHKLSQYSEIRLEDITWKMKNNKKYCAYRDINDDVNGYKFDVISVDAPYGFGGGQSGKKGVQTYARRDIIAYIPEILEDDFIIIVDDSNRPGEMNTIHEITKKLDENEIPWAKGVYRGVSHCCVISSLSYKFLCSL